MISLQKKLEIILLARKNPRLLLLRGCVIMCELMRI